MMESTIECERDENLAILQQLVNSSKSMFVETNACVFCQKALNQSFLVFRYDVSKVKLIMKKLKK